MFLNEQRRKKLIGELMLQGCPRDIAEKATLIPEAERDEHALAHAKVCFDNRLPNGDLTCLKASTACLSAIYDEGIERGMTGKDFPLAQSFIISCIAKIKIEKTQVDLTHITFN